jgi:hypothetical protein
MFSCKSFRDAFSSVRMGWIEKTQGWAIHPRDVTMVHWTTVYWRTRIVMRRRWWFRSRSRPSESGWEIRHRTRGRMERRRLAATVNRRLWCSGQRPSEPAPSDALSVLSPLGWIRRLRSYLSLARLPDSLGSYLDRRFDRCMSTLPGWLVTPATPGRSHHSPATVTESATGVQIESSPGPRKQAECGCESMRAA